MEQMNIISAKYNLDQVEENSSITAIIDGEEMSVPLDLANRHYAAIIEATAYDGSLWGESVPEPLATIAAEWLFNKQLQDYTTAVTRLAQYIVADGREEVTEMQPTGEQVWNEETEQMEDVMHEVVVQTAIDPVEPTVERTVYSDDPMAEPTVETIENPLITQDNAERAEAQAVIDATPQPVIDECNS